MQRVLEKIKYQEIREEVRRQLEEEGGGEENIIEKEESKTEDRLKSVEKLLEDM